MESHNNNNKKNERERKKEEKEGKREVGRERGVVGQTDRDGKSREESV